MKLSEIKKAHLVGIKGTGVSAAAQILAAHGVRVAGSDIAEKFFTEESLKRLKIPYSEEFNASNIAGDEDVVVYSTAYDPDKHLELIEARRRGIPLMSYPEFLSMMARQKLSIAVCGSHGKTTTTAMLAHTLNAAGMDPAAIVGSSVKNWGGGALDGRGNYFVFEADEYQNKLAQYAPWSAILTSVDFDHPDFFPTPESYREVFRKFLSRIPAHGHIVTCGDDAEALLVANASGRNFVTYGFLKEANYVCAEQGLEYGEQEKFTQKFTVRFKKELLGDFETQLIGAHNIQNAAAVIAMSHILKCDMRKVAEGVRTFSGTDRRFEFLGEKDGVIFFDDYAHHPTEIRALLSGVRARYPRKRVLAVFQPHTFSRTEGLFEEFAQCFSGANKVYLLDIYASAREDAGIVTGKQLADRVNRYDHGRAEYAGSIDGAVSAVKKEMRAGDLVLTIGAGDGWRVIEKLKVRMEK